MNPRPHLPAFRFALFTLGIAGTFLISSCQHTYEQVPLGDANALPPRLEPRSIAYVAVPLDAKYKKKLVFDSGQNTAAAIREVLARHVSRAYVGREPETLRDALATAQRAKCTYLIYPSILNWENHATEFSGIRDRLELKLQVVAVATGARLHEVVLKGASRWMTDGGDTPQDLIREPVEEYFASLFQPLYIPSALH